MRLRVLSLVIVLALGASNAGRAQPGSQPDKPTDKPTELGDDAAKKTAQELFIRGREAFKAENWASALADFEKSQSLFARPGTLLNLAISESKLGRNASALKHLDELLPQLPLGDDRIPEATALRTSLESRVPRLRIELRSGVPAGTEVSLDGSLLSAASLDAEMRVDAGTHTIEVRAPGRRDRSIKVTLAERERAVKLVAPTPIEEPSEQPPREPLQGPSQSPNIVVPPIADAQGGGGARTAGIVIGGVGIAGLVVGAVTGGLAISRKNKVDMLCPAVACTEEGVTAEDQGKAFATASTAGFLVGIAGVGLGSFLIVWNGGADARKASARVGPSVTPGGMGLAAMGTF